MRVDKHKLNVYRPCHVVSVVLAGVVVIVVVVGVVAQVLEAEAHDHRDVRGDLIAALVHHALA